MIADEDFGRTLGLRWGSFGHLLSELGVEFIVVGALDLNLL